MPLHVAEPLWLVALLLLPLLAAPAATRLARDRHLRRAALVRAAGVAALVVALAGLRWDATGGHVDLVILVDTSDSTAAVRSVAEAWIDEAIRARRGRDRIAVVAVGRDAQVEHSLRVDPPGGPLAVRVDGTATDLARGLRLAQGLAGSEQRRRVVVLTDGFATRGDTEAAIAELRSAGIAMDVVVLGDGVSADVLVESVRAPSQVRDGEAYDVTITIRNTTGSPAGVEVTLTADGDNVHHQALMVPPGSTEVRVPRVATENDAGRAIRYEARIGSAASTEPRNDVGMAGVQVEGPPRVLLVEGATGDGAHLEGLLLAGGVPVERRDVTATGFPALDELLGYDALVMVDVDGASVGTAGALTLDAYVRDAGRGLTVVGGVRSYGQGGYGGTQLEELLPVFASIRDPQRRPSVAQALVVDVSGSMAACHCRPGGGGPVEGSGPNKTDIAREAVARAIENLNDQDTVGVVAFHTQTQWVLPLQAVPARAIVDDALARLHPDGDTGIGTGLREAIAGLRDVDARLRHIVLFSDGFTNESGLEQIAREALEAGITVSVVGTGEGSGDVLERIAEAGGGRFYPGRDLSSIPNVLASEVQLVSRPLIEEGRFLPIVAAADPVVDHLEASPPLLGYVATTPKPTARTLLRIGDERDPLLASWQAGLGTVVAWTSDATTRWSTPWAGWEGARDAWAAIVRSTLPNQDASGVGVAASVTPDGLRVELVADEAVPAGAVVTAVVADPDGTRREVPLSRTDPTRFSALIPAGGQGIHAVTVRVERGSTELARRTVTAVQSYPAEYAWTGSRGDPIAPMLQAAGGARDPSPADAFRRDGTVPGRTPVDLTTALLVMALVSVPLDVGLRRLRLERTDLRRLLGTRAPEPAATPAPTSSTDPAPPRSRQAPNPADAPPPPPQPPQSEPGRPPPPATGAAALLDARRRARQQQDEGKEDGQPG